MPCNRSSKITSLKNSASFVLFPLIPHKSDYFFNIKSCLVSRDCLASKDWSFHGDDRQALLALQVDITSQNARNSARASLIT